MQPGQESCRQLLVSVTSGSGTGTIERVWSLARRVRVVPPSESTSYDASISDLDGHLIFKRTGQIGTLSEIQELSLGIAGTVAISNGTSDGTYTFKFDMH